jgi:type II secretory pathway pseudopilin PulG
MSPTLLELVAVLVIIAVGGYTALKYLPQVARSLRKATDYAEGQLSAADEAMRKEEK